MSCHNHGQSRFTLLDKLKPRSCVRAKKNVTLMATEGYTPIPFPPPPPPPPPQSNPADSIPAPPSAPPCPATQGQAQQPKPDHGTSQNHTNHNATHANPQNTHQSGQMIYQRPVDITIGSDTHELPGYIRIQGGTHNYGFNNYDAHLPLAELIGAGPEQQAAILSTLSMGRVGGGYGYSSGNRNVHGHGEMRGRLSGGRFIPDNAYARNCNHSPTQNPRAVTIAPHSNSHPQPQPQLTLPAPGPKSTGKAPTHRSDRNYRSNLTEHDLSHSHNNSSVNRISTLPVKTPILDRYFESLAAPPGFQLMPMATTPATAKDEADISTGLTCYVCHATKDPHSRNVKRLAELGDLCLCWRCLHAQIGPDAGVCWFGN